VQNPAADPLIIQVVTGDPTLLTLTFAEPVVATVARLWEIRQFGLIHALASVATTPSANDYLLTVLNWPPMAIYGLLTLYFASKEGLGGTFFLPHVATSF